MTSLDLTTVVNVPGRSESDRQTRILCVLFFFSGAPALIYQLTWQRALFLIFGAFGATTLVFAVTAVWMLATMVMAVRQALDYTSTGRALAVCALGWFLTLVFVVGLGLFFGPGLAG